MFPLVHLVMFYVYQIPLLSYVICGLAFLGFVSNMVCLIFLMGTGEYGCNFLYGVNGVIDLSLVDVAANSNQF